MKKVIASMIVVLIWAVFFVLIYSIIPTIVWIFGGSFRDLAQNGSYAAINVFTAIGLIIYIGHLEVYEELIK